VSCFSRRPFSPKPTAARHDTTHLGRLATRGTHSRHGRQENGSDLRNKALVVETQQVAAVQKQASDISGMPPKLVDVWRGRICPATLALSLLARAALSLPEQLCCVSAWQSYTFSLCKAADKDMPRRYNANRTSPNFHCSPIDMNQHRIFRRTRSAPSESVFQSEGPALIFKTPGTSACTSKSFLDFKELAKLRPLCMA
jgi:hypothetical protein